MEANLKEASFEKQGIKYSFCHRCEHLNGLHDDTDEFHQAIYGEGTSNAYDALMNDVNRRLISKGGRMLRQNLTFI